jgi:uncharacterized SAM-binding protein YcdF (DUF218 family)
LIFLPEVVYWCASVIANQYYMMVNPEVRNPCSVLVLGFPTHADGSPSPIQRYRVETAVRVFNAENCSLMVVAGGSPHSPYVEAETMAQLAMEAGIPKDKLVLETRSRNTRENIRFSLPYLEANWPILLVSDPLHVLRAKRYFCEERPDLCPNVYTRTAYKPFSLYWMKWAGLIGETTIRVRDAWTEPLRGVGQGRPATQP